MVLYVKGVCKIHNIEIEREILIYMYVIINVDDFGLHPAVNRAVFLLSKDGKISSTTVLANGPYAKEVSKINNIGIGVHLNILRGKPLSNLTEVNTLINNNGYFLGDYKKLFTRYLLKKIDLSQIKLEWSKQIELLLDYKIKLTHIDSEKHIHAWPKLMNIAIDLAKRYNIKCVRKPVEKINLLKIDSGLARTIFLKSCSLFYDKNLNIYCPDYVWGIANQGKKLLPDYFFKYISRLKKWKVIEIVCHPGYQKKDDPIISENEFGHLRIHNNWKIEYDSLNELNWLDLFKKSGLKLINYSLIE